MSEHGTPTFTIIEEKGQWIVKDQDGQRYGPSSPTLEAAQEVLESWDAYYNRL